MEVNSKPAVIDLDALLQPISDDNPAGTYQVYEPVYDEIKKARQADEVLPQGDWQRELKVADWKKVIELATTALQTKTKDLQICAWLAEALVKQHGFVGLRDSLRLLKGFHENFWDNVFPEPDPEEVGNELEGRANAIEFFDRQTALAIKEAALTSQKGLNFIQFEESKVFNIPENIDALESEQREKILELKAEAESQGKTTGEMWRKAYSQTKRLFYEEVNLTIEESWEELTQTEYLVDEKFDRQTPGLNNLKKSLDALRDFLKKVLEEKRRLEPDPSDVITQTTEINEAGETVVIQGVAGTSGPIGSRQDALIRLQEVANFFKQTEPHSPVPFLIERSIKWANMSFDKVLGEFVKEENVMGQIREYLGLSDGSGVSWDSGGDSWGSSESSESSDSSDSSDSSW